MKAAARVRAYLTERARANYSSSVLLTENGAVLSVSDLTEVLRSRAVYKEQAQYIRTYAELLNLPPAATGNDVLIAISREQDAVESAREQRTEQTEEFSRRFHDYRFEVERFLTRLRKDLGLPPTISTAVIEQEITRLQMTQDTAPQSKGVRAVSEARAYQMRHHPSLQVSSSAREARREELFAAAMALLLDNKTVYPFGTVSWDGIKRNTVQGYGGRKAQLAHAGACIAALIDLLPPPAAVPKTYAESKGDLR